ncbi:glycosyltransferase family 2 protein [Amylibacter sp.]|nr:glycosyltransferase family 2 protein [Amylibacter sp.]MDC1489166.1 glycosyltransferase family 2 protein [Amylibacter sp.]
MKASIVIPVYNKKSSILRTLNSVLSQSYDDLEILVVDNNSSDGSSELLISLAKDQSFKLLVQSRRGVSFARNYGIKKANGDVIFLLDAGDVIHRNHVSEIMNVYHLHNTAEVVFSLYIESNIDTRFSKLENKKAAEKYLTSDYFESVSKGLFPINSSNISFKRSNDVLWFDEEIRHGEDQLAWLQLVNKNLYVTSGVTSMYMRDEKDSATSQPINKDHVIFLKKLNEKLARSYSAERYQTYIHREVKGVFVSLLMQNDSKLARATFNDYKLGGILNTWMYFISFIPWSFIIFQFAYVVKRKFR